MTFQHHNWSGWPGAWCLDCGCEDPREAALANGDCAEDEHGWPIVGRHARANGVQGARQWPL